jgi:cytochrome P450
MRGGAFAMQIIINVYAINHNKDVWANPEEWNPERVLGDERLDMGFKDHRIFSFGAGKRMCAGIGQAMNIISACIAIMVQHFKWELPSGSIDRAVNTTLLTNQMLHPLEAIAIPRVSSRLSA